MLLRLALIFLVLYVALSAGNTACVHQLGGFQRIADAPTAVTEAACSHADNRLFVIMGFTKFNTTSTNYTLLRLLQF